MIKGLEVGKVYTLGLWEGESGERALYTGFDPRYGSHAFGVKTEKGARTAHISDDHIIRIDEGRVIARKIEEYTEPIDDNFRRTLRNKLEAAGL